jgi:pimeloyl-ACP methyl ester carboxylesterase
MLSSARIRTTSLLTAAVLWLLPQPSAAEQRRGGAYDHVVTETMVVQPDGATSHVRVFAKDAAAGAWIAIVPSLGRGVEDYTEDYASTLTSRLVAAGYRVILVHPRGIGRSTGDLTPSAMSMSFFANDLKTACDAVGAKRVNLIGHAFGNRLARTFATLFSDRVDRVVLLASGGNFDMGPEREACLRDSLDLGLERQARLRALQCAFFARGNDPAV